MAAYSDDFPWPSSDGNFPFFEDRMIDHAKVTSVNPHGDGVYELTRDSGATIRVLVCECYSYGVAEYLETVEKIGKIDAVVISSSWCAYTRDAKEHCKGKRVGLFKISEFMGALYRPDFWNYIPPTDEDKKKKARYL
ncbi:hypothetical protein AB9F35_32270 [Rhizobium leguminosarum]|uniref:hypothetical protein n=1 Tax=Rhizobium leguminosarum TaxID=384 RepID=UPI003F97E6C6